MPAKPKYVAGCSVASPWQVVVAERLGPKLYFNGRTYAPSFISSMPFRYVMQAIKTKRLYFAKPNR